MNPMLRTAALFGLLFGLFALIGYFIGGGSITTLVIFLFLAGIMNLFSYLYSDKIVLASYKAKIIKESDNPRLFRIVAKVASDSNIPMPKVAIVPMNVPNAFATGRNKRRAVVCVTKPLLDYLDDDEMEGVIAHEMAHIRDRDTLVMTIAATVAGAIAIFVRMAYWSMLFGRGRRDSGSVIIVILAAITAPIAAAMIQMAISRTREFKADREGALATGKPWALASALKKLELAGKRAPMKNGNPASASLFIVNPFKGSALTRLFSTHPPTEERIKKLNELSENVGGPLVYL
ncbi:MAG: zinc metalloprotease HtpX [Candidatus Thermoplasmatota archaeon]|nr:zinc metalloprotease HtpX [Candidatus Thermoplasmatota archaeon]